MRLRYTGAALAAALLTAFTLAAAPVHAAPAEEDDLVVPSFDGTSIVAKLFVPEGADDRPVPAILMTHGWGGARQKAADGFVGRLLEAGYAVMTWDQRGFGQSGGMVRVDAPGYEDRDVQALIDVLAADARIAQEAPGDPRIGMAGGSYAGGVQFIAAARDARVDAIAPEIAWNNLVESLSPDGVVKTGWGSLLYASGTGKGLAEGVSPSNPAGPHAGSVDPMLHRAFTEGVATGEFSAGSREWFAERGPDHLLDRIDVPTFLVQATTDTLFTPNQAIDNFRTLAARTPRLPLKMAWFCGGHGSCAPFDAGPEGHVQRQVVAWFDRWVKEDESVRTGARFEYLTNDGVWHGAPEFPVPATATRSGTGSGVVAANGEPATSGLLQGSTARTSLKVPIEGGAGTVVGQPTVRLTVRGHGSGADAPQRAALFLQLVNTTKDEVLGHQVTPKVVATDGRTRTYEFPLEAVAYTLADGDRLALEVLGTSAGYEPYRGAALVEVERVSVEVPALR